MAKASAATLDDLVTQARITNRLIAAQLQAEMSRWELVKILASTGATDKEIADVLDTTPGTVAVTKQRLKGASKKGKKVSESATERESDE